MQAWVARRMADLKTRLQISPAQEPAWTAFADSMKPPATRPARMDWKAFEKLSTPERIDKMHAMRAERAANMEKRESAVKTFYAALTSPQQKVFDLEHSRMHHHMHSHWGHGGHGHMGDHDHGADGQPMMGAGPKS